jgi:hypothetical protein
MRNRRPFYWRVQRQFEKSKNWWHDWPKLLPHLMKLAKTRLYGLIKDRGESYEGFRGAQEHWDQRGVYPMAKIAPPPLYIEKKPYFWRHPFIATKFSLLGSRQGGGKSSSTPAPSSMKTKRGKGPLPLRGVAHLLFVRHSYSSCNVIQNAYRCETRRNVRLGAPQNTI